MSESFEPDAALLDVLERWGCAANDQGLRRLAFLALIALGEIERPKFKPEVRIENQFEALIVEAEQVAGVSRVAAAKAAAKRLASWNQAAPKSAATRLSALAKTSNAEIPEHRAHIPLGADSLRVKSYTAAKQAREMWEAGKWPSDTPPISAAQIALVAPNEDAGQAILDAHHLRSLEKAALRVLIQLNGWYVFDQSISLPGDRRMIGMKLRDIGRSQIGGPPIEGREGAAIKLVTEAPWGTDPTRLVREDILPDECSLHRGRLSFRARLDDGTIVELTGTLASSASSSPDALQVEVTVTPARDVRREVVTKASKEPVIL